MLAAVLAGRRLELDLSQEDLADLAGITRQTVVSLEAGRPASLEVVTGVLDVLGLRFEVVRGATPGGVGIHDDLAQQYGIGPAVEQ